MDLPIVRKPDTCGAQNRHDDVKPCHLSAGHSGKFHTGRKLGTGANVSWLVELPVDPTPMTFAPGVTVTGRLVRMEVTPAGSTIQFVTDAGENMTVNLRG